MFSSCKEGCTDPTSFNYDSLANTDDGSCIPYIEGCMNPLAFNYDPSATVDDGSCVPVVVGCTDPSAYNYNPKANTMNDYSQCIYEANIENCIQYLEGREVYIDNYKSINYKLKFIYNISKELLKSISFRESKPRIKLDTLVYIPKESELGNLSSIFLPIGENIKVIVESKGFKKNYFIDIVFETKSESDSIYLINPLRKNKYKLEIVEYSTTAVSKNFNNEIKWFKAFFNKLHKIDYWFKDPPKEIEVQTYMGFGHEKKYQLKRY